MALARADLESLLRTRQLDRTLTTAQPTPAPNDEYATGPTGVDVLDRGLDGGLPRGHLSEIVGPRTSGRMSVLLHVMAAATRRGELVAVVDALDMLDVASLTAAGVVLDRVLWIRGHVVINPGIGRELNQRAMEQAIRAMSLVLQAGNFGLVVLDVAEAPLDLLRRLPFTTWLRLQRMVEGSQTMALLVGSTPIARSPAGVTLQLGGDGTGRRDRVVHGEREPQPAVVAQPGNLPGALPGALPGLLPAGVLSPGVLSIDGRIIRARARVPASSQASFAARVHVHV